MVPLRFTDHVLLREAAGARHFSSRGFGHGVWGLGFRVQGLGLKV